MATRTPGVRTSRDETRVDPEIAEAYREARRLARGAYCDSKARAEAVLEAATSDAKNIWSESVAPLIDSRFKARTMSEEAYAAAVAPIDAAYEEVIAPAMETYKAEVARLESVYEEEMTRAREILARARDAMRRPG